MDKRIVVAGGAGFIGCHLVESHLADGDVVDVYDNFSTGNPANLREASMAHPDKLRILREDVINLRRQGSRYDVIYNLACPASPVAYQADPIGTTMTCVLGTRNLLEMAQEDQAVFVQASTSEVYGDPLENPQSESYWGNVNPWGFRACYDEGKRCAESLCHDYMRKRGVEARVVRIFNSYGDRMDPNDGRVVSTFLRQAILGEKLTVQGDGEQTRSFCYVDDLVRGLRSVASRGNAALGPVNLGNDAEFTINQLVSLVVEMYPIATVRHVPAAIDDPRCRKPDLNKARALLDYKPTVSLQDGLKRTAAWMMEKLGLSTSLAM